MSEKPQTVGQAIKAKRAEVKGKLSSLVICKRELFYQSAEGKSIGESIFPVSREMVAAEAKRLKVEWFEA